MINVFGPDSKLGDEDWQVWIDVEEDPQNGICLGSASTREEALRDAKRQLQREIKNVAFLQNVKYEQSSDL